MGPIDDVYFYGFPFLLLGCMVWYSRRSGKLFESYRQGQELTRNAQELIRESLRLQTESNQLMRELIDALRQK